MARRLRVRIGRSRDPRARGAAAEIREQTAQDGLSLAFLFCSPRYDLDALGAAIDELFDCPVLACTTAGEFSSAGYTDGGIVAATLASGELEVQTLFIDDLEDFCGDPVRDRTREALADRFGWKGPSSRGAFGLLLVDGLAMVEERLVAALDAGFGGLPIVGGSAGDDLAFERTFVYHAGGFHSSSAVFALVETTLPFKVFKSQHLSPTGQRIVITASDPDKRTVREIDGLPAAEAFAAAIGLSAEELTPEVFSTHPVMLRVGGEYYVRSIQKVNEDGSLTFYCAIDDGLVLTVARGEDLLSSMAAVLDDLEQSVPNLALVLAYDCILRRLEAQRRELGEKIRSLVGSRPLVGFSTYGEQYGSLHVNQTLTGVAIGR
ncbi:MAG: FIST N-terminal domain-containing protein [Acidobacteriota bacterium]|nr:FIST N-terminal domain-containing protein [Acidobacteriota bacterium]MDQ7088358.1 FIST N-terminal domain-containing protein [Acidobacteriota bacterium]